MSRLDLGLRLLVISLIILRSVVWLASARTAKRAKPGHRRPSLRTRSVWLGAYLLEALLLLQLLNVIIVLPFPASVPARALGLALVVLGTAVSISARRTLGFNWSHAADYQVKPGHELVTSGVYHYIRHPIYSSLALVVIGVELICSSWLALVFVPVLALFAQAQAQREEQLLTKEFGSKYRDYMGRSSRFIPGFW